MKANLKASGLILTAALTVLAWAPGARAHCDTLDGPVIADARAALETGDPAPVLKWVGDEYETEIRGAFAQTLAVRKLGGEAKELADMYFFETLVRVHRGGEGAPYTGLKPAGVVEPPVAAADKALASGSADQLVEQIRNETAAAVQTKFKRVAEAAKHKDDSVDAGREYVEAYVAYVHFVEALHNVIESGPAHAEGESEQHPR